MRHDAVTGTSEQGHDPPSIKEVECGVSLGSVSKKDLKTSRCRHVNEQCTDLPQNMWTTAGDASEYAHKGASTLFLLMHPTKRLHMSVVTRGILGISAIGAFILYSIRLFSYEFWGEIAIQSLKNRPQIRLK